MRTSTASTPSATQFGSSKPSSPPERTKGKVALSRRDRRALALQRGIGRITSFLWVPATVALMRFGFGWHIVGHKAARRAYREIWREREAPLLICANHLTMVDSAIVAWALGSPGWYLRRYAALPWNLPEQRNFGSSLVRRVLVYLMKCIPVVRGGEREAAATALEKVRCVMAQGDAALIFPEGGRSRSGRVEIENAAHGVGRLIASLPGCRVLCVYLRGAAQTEMSDLPARGERFSVALSLIEPRTEMKGVRGSLDLVQQVVRNLIELEQQVLGEAR